MAEFPALNLWTDSWLADTRHLGRVERDIYFHLLILMWRSPQCRIPREIDWSARRLMCDPKESIILQGIIAEFCTTDGNWITQKRLTKEYCLALKRSRAATDSANSRWNKDKDSCVGNATTTIITNKGKSSILGRKGREGNKNTQVDGAEFVTIKRGTPEFEAWINHFRELGRPTKFMEKQELITVPTKAPPKKEKVA